MKKIIFITGASRGLGKIWAEAFLKRGDQVIATARNIESLEGLKAIYGENILPLQVDVNSRAASFAAIEQGAAQFGKIDVVINNAGYGHFGTIEELSEQEARDQIETNVFGLLWVTQAAVKLMRAQGHGHIVQISSALGQAVMPTLGIYNASKFAVEGLSETLAAEVASFGIKVTIVEPNGFTTEWGGVSASASEPIEAYSKLKEDFQAGLSPDSFGKPEATAAAMELLIDSENPPLRLFLGKVGFPWVKQVYADRLATWEEWADVATAAHGF
ncbi:SDR family NAD(P)-dependent oxidoreductase [Mucilaginibacter calamicampi]|uniref:SDR family NAD(P)-dependent oxidoreductase n=1 Tax=Mucilaginibacter calamicampi TaxID=1302352 RepID=A0ABW2YZR2_9SPHI